MAVKVDADQVVAFRVAAQGLASREWSLIDALAGWAVQDSPPGSAALALHARVPDLGVDDLQTALDERDVVATYNVRSATVILPAKDLPLMARALDTEDPDELRAILGSALTDKEADPVEAAALATKTAHHALDGEVLARDDLHDHFRAHLPDHLLPWCRSCKSNHARRGLVVIAGLRMALVQAGKFDRQPAFARADQWIGVKRKPAADRAGAELVRRHLRRNAPSTPALFAKWAELSGPHAKRLWALVEDDLAEVTVGKQKRWVLAGDLAALEDPQEAEGARLLPPGDPLLIARDREILIPDEADRKRLWKMLGSPGLALVDGRPAALWRGKKAGKHLQVTLEPFGKLAKMAMKALEEEAAGAAALRGSAGVKLEVA